MEPSLTFLLIDGHGEFSSFQDCSIVLIIVHFQGNHGLEVFVVYHLEMLIGQNLLPISIAFGYGATLYFDEDSMSFRETA